ncbi:hypothetical protein OBBRIDRAFT_19928 [Obba rivulosa]|uniref:Uncharacterized protein n=1 Tax=Obba rivulosa TaxID=1052685 RepID=A0A8E2DSJ6_9APHY|nr:hypothetical protein OBBRIDRAFT_19928 [Obba rivulosa]
MAALRSPQPLHASSACSQPSSRPLLSPPVYLPDEMPYRVPAQRVLMSPPRLLSPIHMAERGVHKAASPPACSPTKRRRGAISNSRVSRRRTCVRSECFIQPGGPALFDGLPWISSMEITPDRVDAWDIADLSLLSVENLPSAEAPRSGPMRRTKMSSRSSPLAPHLALVPEHVFEPLPTLEIPAPETSCLDHPASDPRTPPPRESFIPSEVFFQGLHPAFPPDFKRS